MVTLTYDISMVSAEDKSCFFDMLAYVSPYVRSVKERTDSSVTLIVSDGKEEEVRAKLDFLRSTLSDKSFDMKNKGEETVFSTMDTKTINDVSVYPELVDSKAVIKVTEGGYSYGGLFLKVFERFSEMFDEYARRICPASLRVYNMPVLYPVRGYEKGRYFENFPHHIMFQTLIKNDIEILERFTKNKLEGGALLEEMQIPGNVLRHATCVPVYKWHEDTVADYPEPICYLISGRCFRNEGANTHELSRLNEFTMKEMVFIGTQKQVAEMLDRSRGFWYELIEKFGLRAEIRTANDSFFATNFKKQRLFQMLGGSKYELRLSIPAEDSTIAVSSSNNHRTHFSAEYNIKTPTEYCYSGCVGFGLDRMTYAFLSQKGLDVSKWDSFSRKEIMGQD